MTVRGISGQGFYEKIQKQKRRDSQDGTQAEMAFSNNLAENDLFHKSLKEQNRIENRIENEKSETDEVQAVNSSFYDNSLHTSMVLRESGRVQLQAVVECSARHITYAQSDNVKVSVENGYTFKAQVHLDAHKVYIEKKSENGEVKGYEINPLALNQNTEDPMEQMALETWELARRAFMGENIFHKIDPKEETRRLINQKKDLSKDGDKDVQNEEVQDEKSYEDMTIEEAMQKFYDFVEDRIKNGDPKYQIGAAEMSVKEWNRLLEKIDDEIDAAKEQLREEVRKAKEEAKKATSKADVVEKKEDEDRITKERIARLFEDFE